MTTTRISKLRLTLLVALAVTLLATGLSACAPAADPALSREDSNNRVAVSAVHVAAAGLGEVLSTVSGEDARIEVIRGFIGPIRFFSDQSGYFYVYDYNCLNIAHAVDQTLPGQNLYDYRDMRDNFVIRDLSAAARNGGGFVTYYWPHPETKEEQRKVGYVEPIPGTDYFIGTGYYPNTD